MLPVARHEGAAASMACQFLKADGSLVQRSAVSFKMSIRGGGLGQPAAPDEHFGSLVSRAGLSQVDTGTGRS